MGSAGVSTGEAQPRAAGWPAALAAAAVLSLAWMALLNAVPVASNDLWLQLKVGQLIVSSGQIPQTVLFPFTEASSLPFHAHEWLASVLFYLFQRTFGEDPLMFLQAGFGLLQFALCFVLARRLSGHAGTALLLASAAMLVANFRYVLRPELYALLLLTGLLLVLTRVREGGSAWGLAWCLPIALLWANLHGSFLLGPAVAGLYALGEGLQHALRAQGSGSHRLRQGARAALPYAGAAALMLLASVANPEGADLLRFAFQVQASEAMRSSIKEWLPTFHPLFRDEPAFWIFAVAGLGTVVLAFVLWRFLGITDLLLLLAFAALALDRNRHVVWFGFVSLAVSARLLGRAGWPQRAPRMITAACAVISVVGIFACMKFGNVRGAYAYYAPSNNFSPLMQSELASPAVRGNVLNSYELGSELIWRQWPKLKPSIDSRIDSYGDAYFYRMEALYGDEAALSAFLDRGHINFMLLMGRDFQRGLRRMEKFRSTWHVRLADDRMLLLERNLLVPTEPAPASADQPARRAPS